MKLHYLAPLFEPKSVLVYTRDDDASSAAVLNTALSEAEFNGSITRIVPTSQSFASIANVEASTRPDLALIAVGDAYTVKALTHAAKARVRAAIIYDVAADYVGKLKDIAARNGIHLLGPGSSGLQRPHLKLNACIDGTLQGAGNLALISQSGALTAAMLDWAESNAVSFSAVVATGRSAAIDLADVLDFLAQDGHTHSIVVYMEGIRSGRHFMSALRAAARAKPTIVLKAGRRERGRQAALTHSGAMIGGDDVFDAALERAGAVRVDSFVQLLRNAWHHATNRSAIDWA